MRNGTKRFLLATTAGLLILALGPTDRAADSKDANMINVGVQLYSFRNQMAKDIPGTLELVHKMGVTDVEVAGMEKMTPEQAHEELLRHELNASGIHFQWPRFQTDIGGIINDAKALKLEYVTLPWIPHKGEFTIQNAHDAAAKFNEWGAKLAAARLKFCYHPHGYEFRPHEGGTLFDVMVKETKPEFVNFELDIFWAADGGADPVKLMQKYPNRFPLMHLKDMRKSVKTPNYTGHEDTENDVALGKGQLDIPAILNEAVKIGVKHYYIEDESKESVEQVPASIAYVRSIGH